MGRSLDARSKIDVRLDWQVYDQAVAERDHSV